MGRHSSNYTARERVAHKLAGAAYQMTFEGEYDLAMETMAMAVSFWESSGNGNASQNPRGVSHPKQMQISGDIFDDIKASLSNRDEDGDSDGEDSSTDERSEPQPTVELPSPGSKTRQCLVGMVQLHADGMDWIKTGDIIDEFSEDMTTSFGNLRYQYSLVESRDANVPGKRTKEYRIKPELFDDVTDELTNIPGSEMSEGDR